MQKNIKSTINNFINKFKFLSKFYKDSKSAADEKLTKFAKKLNKLGISANFITITGFVIGLFSINFLSFEQYSYALLCILINRLFDTLDGAIARTSKITRFGVFLDSLFDYMFYSAAIFGFAIARPETNALAAAFLLFAFLSVSCSMLAYAVIDYKHSIDKEKRNSPFYLAGLIQGAEVFVALVISCIIPSIFVVVSIITGILCIIKSLSIVVAAYYNFVVQENDK